MESGVSFLLALLVLGLLFAGLLDAGLVVEVKPDQAKQRGYQSQAHHGKDIIHKLLQRRLLAQGNHLHLEH